MDEIPPCHGLKIRPISDLSKPSSARSELPCLNQCYDVLLLAFLIYEYIFIHFSLCFRNFVESFCDRVNKSIYHISFISVLVILVHQVKLNENNKWQLLYLKNRFIYF